MKKSKVFNYYESCSAGIHILSCKAIEAFKYHVPCSKFTSLIRSPLRYLTSFAEESKAVANKGIMSELPNGGLKTVKIRPETDGNKVVLSEEKSYCFNLKGIKPVTIVELIYLNMSYGEYTNCTIFMMFADSKQDAFSFFNEYNKFEKEKNRRKGVVLDFTGRKMGKFRPMEWDDIILAGTIRDEIKQDVESFFNNEKIYKENNIDWRRGLLLAGPPGCGKTAICRAVATSSPNVPVVYCLMEDGNEYRFLEHAFSTIQKNSPCVAIFEDADSLSSTEGTRTRLLNMLDGLFSIKGMFTIATTNSPKKLDPAISERPSRFDSLYSIENPKECERKILFLKRLGKYAEKIPTELIDEAVEKMDGFSCAFVQEIAIALLRRSFNVGKAIDKESILAAIEKSKKHITIAKEGVERSQRKEIGYSKSLKVMRKLI